MRKTDAFYRRMVMSVVLAILLAVLSSPQSRFTRAQDEGHTVFLPVVLGAAAPEVVQPETDGECPTSGTVDLPPLSSALQVLPPLGGSTEKMSNLDRSLTDYLTVTVCAVVSGDGCTPVATFTSENSHGGLDYIKLQDHHYHVNWNVAKADVGKAVEIRFAVGGLDVGLVSFTPKTNRTVPVKFQIDNHPQIRARVLHEQGYTATEVAQALVDEFDLEALETAWILAVQEGYSAVEVGQALKDVFDLEASEAALILKDVGLSAVDVGWALKQVYDKDALGAAQILKDICFSHLEIGQVLKDVYGLDGKGAIPVLRQCGFNEYLITEVLVTIFEEYFAIVDVRVFNRYEEEPPPEYTAIGIVKTCPGWSEESGIPVWWVCPRANDFKYEGIPTKPYMRDLFGIRQAQGWDINAGIGGAYNEIWVKYDLLPRDSATEVVVGVAAEHWPYWCPNCKPGWQPASGPGCACDESECCGAPSGCLTNGTVGACARIGLCVKKEPFNTASEFIVNLGLSWTWSEHNCSSTGLSAANGWLWPLIPGSQDVHMRCRDDLNIDEEDDPFVYVCSAKGEPISRVPPQNLDAIDAEEKVALLQRYAPQFVFHPDEVFRPASVEWAFDTGELERVSGKCPDENDGCYRLRKSLGSPHCWEGVCLGDLSSAKVYAFWVEKEIDYDGDTNIPIVDLVYFVYFPFNRGKNVEWFCYVPVYTVFGNHVGDWEHLTVRLMWKPESGEAVLKPQQIYLEAHGDSTYHSLDWASYPEKVGTHPVVYVAEGSHGLWSTAGSHNYNSIDCGFDYFHRFYDDTGDGLHWDTWNTLAFFDYSSKNGLDGSTWPVWMRDDFKTSIVEPEARPDQCNSNPSPANPFCGPVYLWGNLECEYGEEWWESCCVDVADYCRLVEGPDGPVSKPVWDPGRVQ